MFPRFQRCDRPLHEELPYQSGGFEMRAIRKTQYWARCVQWTSMRTSLGGTGVEPVHKVLWRRKAEEESPVYAEIFRQGGAEVEDASVRRSEETRPEETV